MSSSDYPDRNGPPLTGTACSPRQGLEHEWRRAKPPPDSPPGPWLRCERCGFWARPEVKRGKR